MTLHIRIADTFVQRLLGLHAMGPPQPRTGLCLYPCRAIHTFGLAAAIDVVFLGRDWGPVRVVHALAPGRIAICLRARCVVELPAGYCAIHRDFPQRIQQGLAIAVACGRSSVPSGNDSTGR